MPDKFIHLPGDELGKKKKKGLSNNRLDLANGKTSEVSILRFQQIDLEDLILRPINRYSQTKIRRLAGSIKNTNNRLINPITVARPRDLRPDSPIIKEFERKNVDISRIKYVVVCGERRTRAMTYNRDEYEAMHSGAENSINPFKTITANILSAEEAKNEEVYYNDSNTQNRQVDNGELIWFIKDELTFLDTVEANSAALNSINEVLPDEERMDQFREDLYFCKLIDIKFDLPSVFSDSHMRNLIRVAEKCTDYVADKMLNYEDEETGREIEGFSLHAALQILDFAPEQQNELVDLYFAEGASAFYIQVNELKTPKVVLKKKTTHKEAKGKLKEATRKIAKCADEYEKMLENMGSKIREDEEEALNLLKEFTNKLNCILEENQ